MKENHHSRPTTQADFEDLCAAYLAEVTGLPAVAPAQTGPLSFRREVWTGGTFCKTLWDFTTACDFKEPVQPGIEPLLRPFVLKHLAGMPVECWFALLDRVQVHTRTERHDDRTDEYQQWSLEVSAAWAALSPWLENSN